MLSLQNIHFSLDTPKAVPLNGRESYLKGWFAASDGNTYSLWFVVAERRFPAFTGFPRPDVSRAHGDSVAFRNTGFIVRLPHAQAPTSGTLIAAAGTEQIALAEGIAIPAFEEEAEIQRSGQVPANQPLISILLTVPDAHVYFVTRCVESILQQRYTRWQLCIACRAEKGSPARAYLEKVSREDNRVHLARAAEGDFVSRMQHQDELHPAALSEVARVLDADGPLDLVYTDEEEIDLFGNRVLRLTKPDFDPEALLSWNFVGKMAALRREILLNESDDWDVLLRMVEVLEAPRVRHIPKPLYYSRQRDEAAAVPATPIRDYIARTGTKATVEPGLFPGSFRLKREKQAAWQIAVFLRPRDGSLQHAALAPIVDPRTTRVYELLDSGASQLAIGSNRLARDLVDIPEDVFVFINRPLETLNHFFFEELAAQAMREDCGLVTGVSPGQPQLGVVQGVDSISSDFFAVKRSQIAALGGFDVIVRSRMPEVVANLTKLTRSQNARVLVTPYAVATFDLKSNHSEEPMADSAEGERNLAAQLREVASERNHLRRELTLLEEAMARVKAEQAGVMQAQIQLFNKRIDTLQSALTAERHTTTEMRNSLSWKLTRPLRAKVRLVRRES